MTHRILTPLLAVVFASVGLALTSTSTLAQDETIDACVHHGSGVLYLKEDRGSAGEACDASSVNPEYVGPSLDGTAWRVHGPPGFFVTKTVVHAICATVETAE